MSMRTIKELILKRHVKVQGTYVLRHIDIFHSTWEYSFPYIASQGNKHSFDLFF